MAVTNSREHLKPGSILSIIPENNANGTKVYQKGDIVTILTWRAFSPQKKSGTIATSQWGFRDQTERVILQSFGIFSVLSAAWEQPPDPATCLPDSHIRLARQYGRHRTNKQRFRRLTIPKATELKDINEVFPKFIRS